MKLKVDNPELQEVVAVFQRDGEGISIADLAVYEAETGNKMTVELQAPNSIIPADKMIEILATLYPDFTSTVPTNKSSYEDALSFVRKLAAYVVWKIRDGVLTEINDLFIVVELILNDGTQESRDLIIDFLEDFQTVFFNEKLDFELVKSKIHPLSMQVWNKIDSFWKEAATYIRSNKAS